MNVKRTLTIGVVGGALAVWLAAAATSPTPPSAVLTLTPPSAVDRSGAALSAEFARWRQRLRPSAKPAQSRNLFRYQARSAEQLATAGDRPVAVPPTPQPEAPAPMAVSPLKLVGMAEDPGPSGAVRTAILSGFGDLFFAKEGDTIANRYRVTSIGADLIELIDSSTNAPLRILVK